MSWMQASNHKVEQAKLQADAATKEANLRAQASYDRVVSEAKATMQAVVDPAQKRFDEIQAASRATYDRDSADAIRICDEACKAANEIYETACDVGKESYRLSCAMCEEIYEVEIENIAPENAAELHAAWTAKQEKRSRYKAIFDAACSQAAKVRAESHKQANRERQRVIQPMYQACVAATKDGTEAFEAVRRRAQQAYDEISRPAFDELDRVSRAAHRENFDAYAAIRLAYANECRVRVQAWHRLLAALEEFGPAVAEPSE